MSQSSQSTIDLVFFSILTVQTHVHNSSASDDFGVIIESRSINTKKDSKKKSFISRNWKKLENIETKLLLNNKIREKFENKTIPKKIPTSSEMLQILLRILEKVPDEIIPHKNIKPQSETKRWITKEVKNQCSKKVKFWKKFLVDKLKRPKENSKGSAKNVNDEKSLGLNLDPSKDISATVLNDFSVEVGPKMAKKFNNNFEISSIPQNEKSLFLSKTDKLEVFIELQNSYLFQNCLKLQ